jgi:uncharacterized protein (TIRG00374 family)
MMSRILSYLLRFLVTVFFIYLIVRKVDWEEARALLSRLDFFYLALSLAVGVVLVYVSAWKWEILLRARGKPLTLGRCFHLYLIGYFFNNILPSNVGGDVIRAYEAGKETGDRNIALASVFLERFTGLTALILLAVISFISNLGLFGDARFALALGAAFAGYGVIFALVAVEGPLAFLRARLPGKRVGRIMAKLVAFQNAIRSYSKERRALAVTMVLSFVFYVLAVLNVYVSSLAFGTEVSLLSLVVIVPVILVISMIPISLGGVGLQEWAYVFTFSAIGAGGSPEAGASVGILVALLMRLKGIAYGAIGGFFYAVLGIGKQARAELSGTREEKTGADALRFHEMMHDERKSALKKYQMIHLGNASTWQLLKYELLMLSVNDLPGALGLYLRQKLYRRLLGGMGRGVALGRCILFRQPSKIRIDDNAVVDDFCLLSVRGSEKSGITIGKNALVGRYSCLSAREGRIEIQDFANLSSHIRVGTSGDVIIGKYAIIAAFCYIGGVNHRIDRLDVPMTLQGSENRGGVVLEEDVWLGAGVLVNDGVRIGKGSVVGAGSVVTKDIPPYSIAIGVPARVVGSRLKTPRRQEEQTELWGRERE